MRKKLREENLRTINLREFWEGQLYVENLDWLLTVKLRSKIEGRKINLGENFEGKIEEGFSNKIGRFVEVVKGFVGEIEFWEKITFY